MHGYSAVRGYAMAWAAFGAAVLWAGTSLLAAPVGDDFNDNAIGPAWQLLTDHASTLTLVEQNQRLEVIANAPSSNSIDALYLSNGSAGFTLPTTSDFALSIDYAFAGYSSAGPSGSAMALVLGVGRDLAGTDSAAIGFGWVNFLGLVTPGATVRHRVANVETADLQAVSLNTTGTFQITYDAASDDLTLGIQGTLINHTLSNVVRGQWHADELLVSFGARGGGFTLAAQDGVFLDNFVVPEPTSGTVAAGASLLLLLGRRRRHAIAS